MIDQGNPISELHLAAPIQPSVKDGRLTFSGGSGRKIAQSVVSWIEDHPTTEVRAVVPIVADGELQELIVMTR